ncbi:phosphate butyryltransferase [candidate division GN15 bacterium]|nr:phosphate butyryltransferase [candidate division GN15 bacterium]
MTGGPMTLKPIHSAQQLIERATVIADMERKKRVAVAAAQDADVISAVSQAQAEGFLDGVLVGDADLIKELAEKEGADISKLDLVDKKDVSEAAHEAVRLASNGEANAIMKGFLPTSALLKTVLDKAYHLRATNTLSHCAVLDIPGYHKLLNFTDGGMVVKPNPEQKVQILENAVLVGRALGLSPVKVAISGASERISDAFPHTFSDAESVKPEASRRLKDVVIQGPLPFDLAASTIAAEYRNYEGPVLGDADIYLVDSIEEGNIVAKSLIQFAGAIFCGVIVGAKVPVSLVSRTDTVMNKKASLALACVIADYYSEQHVWEGK